MAKPRPVAMYRAPPNVRLLRTECVWICVEKTSKTGDSDMKCLPRRTTARIVPRSVSSASRYTEFSADQSHQVKRTLHEQRQEGDEEHQKNADDTPSDPVKHRYKIIAPLRAEELANGVVLTDRQLFVKRSQEHHCEEKGSGQGLSDKEQNLRATMKTWTERMTNTYKRPSADMKFGLLK